MTIPMRDPLLPKDYDPYVEALLERIEHLDKEVSTYQLTTVWLFVALMIVSGFDIFLMMV